MTDTSDSYGTRNTTSRFHQASCMDITVKWLFFLHRVMPGMILATNKTSGGRKCPGWNKPQGVNKTQVWTSWIPDWKKCREEGDKVSEITGLWGVFASRQLNVEVKVYLGTRLWIIEFSPDLLILTFWREISTGGPKVMQLLAVWGGMQIFCLFLNSCGLQGF